MSADFPHAEPREEMLIKAILCSLGHMADGNIGLARQQLKDAIDDNREKRQQVTPHR